MVGHFRRCDNCDEYGWVDAHRCNRYEINIPEWTDEEWNVRWASDMETAARKAVEEMDCHGDYTVVAGKSEPIVHVRNDEITKTFRVHGEAVPEYYATEVKNEANPGASAGGDP